MPEQQTEESSLISFHNWSLNSGSNASADKCFTKPIQNVSFHSIKFSSKCTYIWIGDSECKMDNLACAVQTQYSNDPIGIDLLSINSELSTYNQLSKDLSAKLAKKLKKQVIVSFNVSITLLENEVIFEDRQDSLLQLIEKCLFEEIKKNPQNF